jgi:RHS repeat-associated protein
VTQPDGNGGTKTTSYVYDADGNRLVTRTDTDTTLFLGGTEVTLTKGSTEPKATRYYDLGGGNQAIRTDDNKVSFLIADHNGTAQLAIDADDLTLQKRWSTPFGGARGTAPAHWPGQKDFVGGTKDKTTGDVHLGARDYDPTTGRFLSVDPVLDLQDPQQFNAYAYSNSSPVTRSDPTGLESCYPDDSCTQKTIETINKKAKETDVGEKGASGTGHSPGGSGSLPVGRSADGQPTINGIRVPKYKELSFYMALDEKTDTYAYRFQQWVYNACSSSPGPIGKWVGFCKTASKAGLLGETQNDPLGITANIHCVTGHGDCTEAVVGDLLTVASWGLGRVAASARFLSIAGKEGSASAKILRAVGAICSFSPDTRVLLKDGRTKAIAKIKPGDKVEAGNPKTGKPVGARRTTARLVHRDDDLIDLTIRVGKGHAATLHTTSRHPFWDDTKRAWVPAGELTPGHSLNTPNGHHARLISVTPRHGEAAMYNLTVEQLHTY